MHSAGNVCVTTGSQEAMYVTLKTLLDPANDELLVVEPAFPSYVKMAHAGRRRGAHGGDARRRRFRDSMPTASSQRSATRPVRSSVLAVQSHRRVLTRRPSGTTGSRRSETRRRTDLADPRRDLSRANFRGRRRIFGQVYPHTIVTNSLSKSNALTGLRLGWILGPDAFVEQAIKAHAWVTSCADSFAQYVAMQSLRRSRACANTLRGIARSNGGRRRLARERPARTAHRRQLLRLRSLARRHGLAGRRHGADRKLRRIGDPRRGVRPTLESWLRLSWVAPVDRVREGISRIEAYCAAALSS